MQKNNFIPSAEQWWYEWKIDNFEIKEHKSDHKIGIFLDFSFRGKVLENSVWCNLNVLPVNADEFPINDIAHRIGKMIADSIIVNYSKEDLQKAYLKRMKS